MQLVCHPPRALLVEVPPVMLRRFLDGWFAPGREDGLLGKRANPTRCGDPGARVEPYARWAYDAGWRQGASERKAARCST